VNATPEQQRSETYSECIALPESQKLRASIEQHRNDKNNGDGNTHTARGGEHEPYGHPKAARTQRYLSTLNEVASVRALMAANRAGNSIACCLDQIMHAARNDE
jgi:hypothetical protein